MTIRLNQPIPPRFADALGFSCLLVFTCLFVYFLVDSGRDWVSTFFIKQVARIHFHQETKVPYGELRPPLESIWYDPVEPQVCRELWHSGRIWTHRLDLQRWFGTSFHACDPLKRGRGPGRRSDPMLCGLTDARRAGPRNPAMRPRLGLRMVMLIVVACALTLAGAARSGGRNGVDTCSRPCSTGWLSGGSVRC